MMTTWALEQKRAWVYLSELEETEDTKPFFAAVRKFYIATIRKMTKKFPFDDTLLKDLGILQPEKTSDHDVSTVVKLAKRFPQLQLNTPAARHPRQVEGRVLRFSAVSR